MHMPLQSSSLIEAPGYLVVINSDRFYHIASVAIIGYRTMDDDYSVAEVMELGSELAAWEAHPALLCFHPSKERECLSPAPPS
jgi:hypothetical protein